MTFASDSNLKAQFWAFSSFNEESNSISCEYKRFDSLYAKFKAVWMSHKCEATYI